MKSGEVTAFARLIERHHRSCLTTAHSILRNHDDAEDEVQAAWVKAWAHLGAYEGQACFSGWLSRIVTNQCLMRLRKTRLMPSVSVDQVFESEGSFRLEVVDQRALPEDLVGDEEVAGLLLKEMRGIPPLLREVLVMRDVGQLSMREIASCLALSVPAVKSRLTRARVELKRRLVKHHGRKGSRTLLEGSGRRRTAYLQAS